MVPSIFEETLFSKKRRRETVAASQFIKSMHPKAEIQGNAEAITRVLSAGWVGQLKIHGHRAQIHISADADEKLIAYTRQGSPHKKLLPKEVAIELRRVFAPTTGWNVIDAEWLKDENKLFVFDFIKKDGQLLNRLNYAERFKLIPRNFISPYIQVLPLLTTLDKCLEALSSKKPEVEGLVFKSINSAGFSDTSIVRCRKVGSRP